MGRQKRILVIDDDELITETLVSILSRDYYVDVATTGRMGLETLSHTDTEYDVILCDLKLPDLDGVEIYRQVQRINPIFVSKFLFMTGGAFTKETEKFIEENRVRMIEKPFRLNALLVATQSVIDEGLAGL